MPRATPEYKMAVGRRLRELREGRGWTLLDVERRSDGRLQLSRISNYEQGLRLPGPAEAAILGKVFEVPAAYVLRIDDEMEPLTKLERQLIRDFRALPEADRMAYARRINSLAATYRDPVPDETISRILPPIPGQEPLPTKHGK